MLLKDNNPWVGLASYKSQDAARFFGREKESRTLAELIQANYCTILYGQSGAGKTSLIQAGVCPILSSAHYLPIPIKLDHTGTVSYARQIMERVEEEIQGIGGEIEIPVDIPEEMDDQSRAWLFFHTATFWDGQNFRITPAFFVDQFEELFTLTSDPYSVQGFFNLIDRLLQMIPPENISEAFERKNIRLPYQEKPAFRLVLSLREDFLARLEDYSYSIPALRRNRIGLAPMNGQQALEVIMNPIPGLVDRDAALRILSKVTDKEVHDDPYFLEKMTVDSCILSLFCTEIYNQAAESGRDSITQDIIDQFGNDIIQTFYERNMDGISSASVRYLESHLLTTNGFRNMVALEDMVPEHVKMEELRKLEENRIIRIETMNGTQRVEFTHDVLCKVATNHRKTANAKSERRKGVWQSVFYWMECFIHTGLAGCFLFHETLDLYLFGIHVPLALSILVFLLSFLFRLGHLHRKYKSPLLMAGVAIVGWWLFLMDDPDDLQALFLLPYAITGTIYFFTELARQQRAQNVAFLRDSFLITYDRRRWAAVLAFLGISYGLCGLYANRELDGVISFILLSTLIPLILEAFCFFFPERSDLRTRLISGGIAQIGILLLAVSQYIHTRVWYYAALAILAVACVIFFRRLKMEKNVLKPVFGAGAWVLIAILLPVFTLGYFPWSLGSMARVPHGTIHLQWNSFPNLLTVRDRDGFKGILVRDKIVLPPEFESINDDCYPNSDSYFAKINDKTYSGELHDIQFFSDLPHGWTSFHLSLFPATDNPISSGIARERQLFLMQADSAFNYTAELQAKGRKKDSLFLVLNDGWKPFLQYYDPEIQLCLANYYRNNQQKCAEHIGNFFRYAGALVHTDITLYKDNQDDDEEDDDEEDDDEEYMPNMEYFERDDLLKTILYARFFKQTDYLPNSYEDRLLFDVAKDEQYRQFLDKLLLSPVDSTMRIILDDPKLRHGVYTLLFNHYDRAEWMSMLTMPVPQMKEFVSKLMELEDSQPISNAYYSLFLGNFEDAIKYSCQAIDNKESVRYKGTALTNLIPALFLKGEMDACRDTLEKYAYLPTTNYSTLIEDLFSDLDYFHLFGVIPRNNPLYADYHELLQSYTKSELQSKHSAILDKEGEVICYFSYFGEYLNYYQKYQEAELYVNGKRIDSFDSILIPNQDDAPAVIMVQDGKKGFIDSGTGRIILPASADHAWFFSEGRAFVEDGNQIRVIDLNGNPAFERTFVDPRVYGSSGFIGIDFVYHDGLAPMIDENGKMGLIDTLGNWVVRPEYDYITNPDDEGKRRYVKDKDGEESTR